MTASFLSGLAASISDVWTDRPRRTGPILAVSSIVLLILAAALATTMALRVDNATKWVEHTYQVRGLAARGIIDLQDVESASNDNLLNPSPESLEAYRDARRTLLDDLEAVRRLVLDNPAQVNQADAISALVRNYFDLLDPVAMAQSSESSRIGSLPQGDGRTLSRRIRELLAAFDDDERELLQARRTEADRLQARLLGLTLLSIIFATITSVAVVTTSWSYISSCGRSPKPCTRAGRGDAHTEMTVKVLVLHAVCSVQRPSNDFAAEKVPRAIQLALFDALRSKKSAWLIAAFTASGRKGLVMRKAGSGFSPVASAQGRL